MSYLTVVTTGLGQTVNGVADGVQVMQYLGGGRWHDVTYDLQRVNYDGTLAPEGQIENEGASAIAFMDNTLIVCTWNGARYLDKQKKRWKVPQWDIDHGPFYSSRFHEHEGKYYVAGQRLIRLSSLLGEPEVLMTNGLSCISSIITSLSGAPELVLSASGTDVFYSFALPSLVRTFTDSPGGSCGYEMYEYQGVVHSANEYGWTYRSTDGRNYGQHNDDIGDHNLWALWEVSGQFYGGTCAPGGVSTCRIIRFDGNLWSTSPTVLEVPTTVYAQGFIRAIQDPASPGRSYVVTGLPYGGSNPDESKCYIFDGQSLTDISPPAKVDGKPLMRFGAGIQAMCFAPNLVRGKTKIGKAAQHILVSSQKGIFVKADVPVKMNP